MRSLRLLKNLAAYALQHAPDDFDEIMTNVATSTTRLNAEVMLGLLTEPPPKAGASGRVEDGIDIGGELRSRFNEEQLGAFVAENVARDRGATGRLAEAFNSLATSDDQRRTALLLAEERVSLTPLGSDPQFNEIWADTVSMLMSYSDADYVPDEYDRELTSAREMAVEVEQVSDDPPDRIAAWLSTVNDNDLRALDQQMLVDLLRLEDRPDAWASVLELTLTRLEQLVLVGDLALARELLDAVVGRGPHPRIAVRGTGQRRDRAPDRGTAGESPAAVHAPGRRRSDAGLERVLPGDGAGADRAARQRPRQGRQPPGGAPGEGRADRLRRGGARAGQGPARLDQPGGAPGRHRSAARGRRGRRAGRPAIALGR